MELIIRHFTELSAEELYEMYRLRVTVFVVEQRCPYQEIDVFDKAAYHLWLKDAGGIQRRMRGCCRRTRALKKPPSGG